ncbi:helix-turn-helix domain-containing protein [Pseudonocardia spinosispora]|uniref:helix-turn-helix domain-containing protein n=1 Tax=Pseudonocardia spinosispora TaxID=103441 RepID=UPI000490AAD8|nr:helix-turn-helix domain-containing protein [Pseudonocardia spinosispora]
MDNETRQSAARSPEPETDRTLLTVAEVAAMVRVSKMTIYRLAHAGELPSVRVGRSIRIPTHAVETLRAVQQS